MNNPLPLAAGTGHSVVVSRCQVCGAGELDTVIFLGYLPPVNEMPMIGTPLKEEASYPAKMLHCRRCRLVQLGLIVDPAILFPPTYPYTSGTTKILRENFAELFKESSQIVPLSDQSLVVDIGSNDGTLLSNFKNGGCPVLGIEPTLMANLANERGIRSVMSFFDLKAAQKAKKEFGSATVVTATNVFAHIENVHSIVDGILHLLSDKGVFISESHYLPSLLETLQYDTIYHEHLRYYSLTSLRYLFEKNGLEIIHCKKIPTHGGSVRVYAARKGVYTARPTVEAMLREEERLNDASYEEFRRKVTLSKLNLYKMLAEAKNNGSKIYGIGAPSRASTLIHYVGLDEGILDCVLEISGSYKIGKYMPGTLIPVREESSLFSEQPDFALLLSWHIADELMPKLRQKGFKGKFIIPLPQPRIVD